MHLEDLHVDSPEDHRHPHGVSDIIVGRVTKGHLPEMVTGEEDQLGWVISRLDVEMGLVADTSHLESFTTNDGLGLLTL
jgi:hypothetical protein